MTEQQTNLAPAGLISGAITSLSNLMVATLQDAPADKLIALSTLCARWQHAIGDELERRHKNKRARWS